MRASFFRKPGFRLIFLFAVCGVSVMAGCKGGSAPANSGPAAHSAIHNNKLPASGSAPVDSAYLRGQTVIVHSNTGSPVKTGHAFAGRNTKADGSGINHTQGQASAMGTMGTMGTMNATSYSKGTDNPSYTGTYDGNAAASGSGQEDDYRQEQAVTVPGNTGSAFTERNTNADGSGISHTQGQESTTGKMSKVSTAGVTSHAKRTPASAKTKYAYVVNKDAKKTASQRILKQMAEDAGEALTAMALSTAETGWEPYSVTVDPSGKHAYVANYAANTISQYTIGADGALMAMTPATVVTGRDPYSVTVDPSGKHVYVANDGDNTVSQYTIGANGALVAMTPATVAAGSEPDSVTVAPSGKYAYVADYGGNTVSQYTIGANGALVAMTPATVATGNWPESVTVDPSGKYAYVTDYAANTVSQYTIGANGALVAMTPATVATGKGPRSVTVHPSGKYAYVADEDGRISQYTIGATGALMAMTPATVATGNWPESVTVDPSGKYVYVAAEGGSVSQYTIGADGALMAMTPAMVATGWSPYSLTVSPSGKHVYVANGLAANTVSEYTIGANGALTCIAKAKPGRIASVITARKARPADALKKSSMETAQLGAK